MVHLADNLGLSSLCETAADHLVVLLWHRNMKWLVTLLNLTVYKADTQKRNKLLHHPQRGAYTELQVLAVLEDMGIPTADCASGLELQNLQPAELRALLAILVDCKDDGSLLRAAVKQELVPEDLRAAPKLTKNVWIVHDMYIRLSDARSDDSATHPFPSCKLHMGI